MEAVRTIETVPHDFAFAGLAIILARAPADSADEFLHFAVILLQKI
jgi:hypothetical protein